MLVSESLHASASRGSHFLPVAIMGRRRACLGLGILLHLLVASKFSSPCDATRTIPRFADGKHSRLSLIRQMNKLRVVKNLGFLSSNTEPYGVSSPFTLPPYDSLSPIPLPDISPPYCIFPPSTPQPPSTPTPSTPYIYTPPIIPIQNPPSSPPESFPSPSPPESIPSPPIPGVIPSPSVPGISPSPTVPGTSPSPPVPGSIPGPPTTSGPPFYFPSPPSYFPSPGGGGIVPSPPIFHPPIIYPLPMVPPPPKVGPSIALWCVAKPSVPEPIIQEAMNYACGSGADCLSIQPEGPCFQPNTLFAHASYAFNSYWQRTKVAGGSCSFGGTAILVTVDPSYDGCHFVYS